MDLLNNQSKSPSIANSESSGQQSPNPLRVFNSLCELYRSYFDVSWAPADSPTERSSTSSRSNNGVSSSSSDSPTLSHRTHVTLSWSTSRPGARQLLEKRSAPIPIGIIRAALYLLCSAGSARSSDTAAAGDLCLSPAVRSLCSMLMRDGRPPRVEFAEKTLASTAIGFGGSGVGVWNSILDDALVRRLLLCPVGGSPKGLVAGLLPELDCRRVLGTLLDPGAEHLLATAAGPVSNSCPPPPEPQTQSLNALVKELEDRASRSRPELSRALDTLPDALRQNASLLISRLADPNAQFHAPFLLALLRQQFPFFSTLNTEAVSYSNTECDIKVQAVCKQFQTISSRPKRLFWV